MENKPTSDDYYSTVSPSTTTSSTVLSPSGATNFDGSAVASSSSELDDLLDRMLEIQPPAVATSSYNNCGSYFGGSVDLSNNSIISTNNQNASGHVFLLQETTNNAMMTDSLLLEAAAAAQHWSNELAATTGTSTATRCSLPLSDFYYHHHYHHHGAGNHQAQQFTLPNFYPTVLPTMGSAAAVIATGDSSYYTAQQQQPQHHQTVSSAPRSTTLPYVLPHSHHHHHQQHQRYHHTSAVGTTPCEENAIADSAQQQCYVAGQFGADGADVYAMAANQQQQQQQQQSRRSLRFPFERTVSSPEFYGPLQQYFPDLTNLHTGHSQSMPTFDNNNSTSAATLDMELHHHLPNYTPSPENLSTGSRSPTYYNSGSSFGYFCSSPSGVMHQPPTLLKSQKSLPLNQLCAVCGDSAQCQHYGVRTCEGCKGFFKRTVQKKSKYVCLGAKDCVIDKRRRNRCQYCRFQKCLTVGMVREVVRTDSLKGRRGRLPSKSKNTEEYAMPGGGALSLTKALYQAFTCADVGQSASTPTIGRADQLVDSINASLVAVQRLAEKIPGWAKLTLSDRLTLLHNGAVNVLSLKLAHLSMNVAVERRIVFDDGYMYIVDNCDEHWRSWLESILDLAKNLKSVFDKDITGFCCLSGIALLKHENLHMENVEEVDKLKNNVINCLKEHCTYSPEAKNKPSQYFATILSKLSDLTAVASKAGECYASCKWDGVQLPMIVDEIFARIGSEQKCCLILP